jgi:D-arginine dehydrogenase
MPAQTAEFAVIGAGIAGASVAAHLAEQGSVILLEREAQPGYHSTGRSAALFTETYGNSTIRLLSRASRAYYEARADGLAEHPILSPRGLLVYAPPEQMAALDAAWADLSPLGPPVHRLGTSETREIVPVVRPERVAASIFEPGAMDIDVHGLHGAYLRRARHRGCLIVTDVQVTALSCGAGSWTITTPVGDFVAPVVVNAAGAWADEVAGLAGLLPVGLVPKRRTAFIVAAPTGFDSRCWPLTGDIDETVYLKPDAGKLLVSPADETPIAPCDVQPEELDVARAIDRLMRDTIVEVRHVERKWAGLRSFVADKTPVVGFDPLASGFFWLAGQGGYGIQTAEGMAKTAAGLITRGALPDDIAALGIEAEPLSPARMRPS